MRRSEWLTRIALVFVALYGLNALTNRMHEKFPAFAWDLFSSVPNPYETDYSARIVGGNNLPVRPPVFFEDSGLQNAAREIQGFFALQVLGKALQRGDSPHVESLRRSFESAYLGNISHVRYEIVRRTYNIRTRVRCRSCFTSVKVLGTFTVG